MARRTASADGRSNSTDRIGSFRIDGKNYPVIERMRVGRRTYLLLEKLGHFDRERYLAVDPSAGPGGEKRCLLCLPPSPAAKQHLAVLKRGSKNNVNVPRLVDYQAGQDRLILVIDWIAGPTLEEVFARVRDRKQPRPSPYESIQIIRGLAHGLSRLHYRRQVIHGDIKPANLVLAEGTGALTAIDFGSAWLAERSTIRHEGDGRSAAYAAPEQQLPGGAADFRADQFSVSVVLYELLTLELPYDQLGGKAGRAEYRRQMEGELVPPSKFAKRNDKLPDTIWRAIDRTVMKGLELDAGKRFPTHREWLTALDDTFHQLKHPEKLTPLNAALTRLVDACADYINRRGGTS